MTFRSQVDTWMGAALWCCVLLATACGVFVIAVGASASFLAVSLPVLVLMSGLCLWVRYATTYTLSSEALLAASGPFKRTIRLSDLDGATPGRSWHPGLALSLSRIRLDYAGRCLYISPENQAEFLAELYRLKLELAQPDPSHAV